MKTIAAATPLVALDAVAVDTETTGLDTSKARIVQIGAVEIVLGHSGRRRTLERHVDPGVPIPPASSAVHGITDAMIAGAPDFAAAHRELLDFAAGRVMVGHSIGFDLAVLAHESARAGLDWSRPRALCVRMLATICRPDLPDYSLDTLAAWLGIEVTGRHSALGDARAAAAIFTALAPKLRERGIRTLAEAENATLSLSQEREQAHRAGWAEPVAPPQAPAFAPVDSFAYRHTVADLMSSPPLVVAGDTTARAAVALMVERSIGSLLVEREGGAGRPIGDYSIVTERDVMRRIAADDAAALDRPLSDFASRPVASVRAAAFAYRAIGRMERLRIRHLAVRDEGGSLVGMVSARDMLRLRASSAIVLDDAIEGAAAARDLATAWATLPAVIGALIAEDVDASLIAGIVSEELRAMTRRATILAEEALHAEGLGPPPCPYCVLVLGSGGRGESLLSPDQDNAIVFAGGDPDGPQDAWFARLGAVMADILDTAGIPYCKGGVMAKNPGFRGSLETWQTRIANWVRLSRPQDLLNVDIFFDFRAVHGDLALAGQLIDAARGLAHDAPAFAKLLGESVEAPNPFTLFGGFQIEDGRLDLKKYGLFPIVATARTLAIRHDVRENATRRRLEGLLKLGIGGDADLGALIEAHAVFMALLLSQQSRDLATGTPVSNRVDVSVLDSRQRAALKAALKSVQAAPTLVRDMMFG